MRSRQQSPVWPYLGVLACLFVLSITAPRAWDRMARQQGLGHLLASRKIRSAAAHPTTAGRVAETTGDTHYEPVDATEWSARGSISEVTPAASEPTPVAAFDDPRISPDRPLPASDELQSSQDQAVPAPDDSRISQDGPVSASDEFQSSQNQPVPAPEPVGQVVPPAPEFAQQVHEEVEVANRPTPPPVEPPLETSPETPAGDPEGQVADEAPPTASTWPLPQSLLVQLRHVIEEEPSAAWAQRAIDLIEQLCQADSEAKRPAGEIIRELRTVSEGNANAKADPRLEAQIARTRYALARRLDVWEAAAALATVRTSDVASKPAPERIGLCLAEIETLSRRNPAGAAWKNYLQLEGLRHFAEALGNPDLKEKTAAERRAAARRVLDRMASGRLTRAQQKFVAEGPLAALQTELRSWAAEPVTSARLLAHLEQYERTGLASDAALVANDWRGLDCSSGAEAREISQHLDTHYRNANLRIAVSGALVNRMLPQPEKIEAPVRDTVVNVPVYGRSTTYTKLSVRLVPDPRRIRLGLEATGLVASDTVSTSGPAKFYNSGQSNFLVRKLMVLGPQGLSVWPAIAQAENNYSDLVALETDFDGVPLVSSLVRNIARSQHDEALGEARMEMGQKVAMRARDQLDAEVRPRLAKAAQNIQKKQLATLDRLGVELVPIGLVTTDDRIVARLRLAGSEQLGAHTARPRAPSDSWFSLQIHQSALNNIVERLDLGGREFALPELFAWIAKKLDRPQLAALDDLPEDVHVTFASQDPIRLRCEADRVELTLALAELTQGGNRWRNFTVRTLYRPEAKESDPCLVRDSMIYLEGRSVRGKPEVVLRAIFNKVLSRNRDLRLLNPEITADPRIKDLEITQFVVEDGWIGLAYSPRRVPNDMAHRPKK